MTKITTTTMSHIYMHYLKKNLGHGIPNKGFKKIEIAKTNADSRSNSKRCPIVCSLIHQLFFTPTLSHFT